jgi:hypothetical protein
MLLRLIYLSLLFAGFTVQATAQKDWTLGKEEDGIRVFTRIEPGSKYKAFKAEMQVNCSMDDVVAALKSADAFGKCITYSKEVRLLKTEADAVYYYVHTDLPWPCDDRDMVYQLKFTKTNTNQVYVTITGMPDYIPHKEGVIRIENARGYWIIKKTGNGKTAVTNQMYADPAGLLPAWVVNLSIVNIPLTTFKELRKIINS